MSNETPVPPSEDLSAIEAAVDAYLERCRLGDSTSALEILQASPELAARAEDLAPILEALGRLERFTRADDANGNLAGELALADGSLDSRVGDYRLIRELGRGGMGVVFEAEQLSLGRRVALKMLSRAALLDASSRERFLREARAAARMRHPHIVPVFDVGDANGIPYYAMQFVEGFDLASVLGEVRRITSGEHARRAAEPGPQPLPGSTSLALRLLGGGNGNANGNANGNGADHVSLAPYHRARGALPERYFDAVARIVRDAAQALHHAHETGVLHRDIKPSNLLLDARGEVWVADFGLAKGVEENGLTRSGDVVGTLRYMAPERFEGRCDAKSDVYALGATLYELVTTAPAFEAPERDELLRAVATGVLRQPREIVRGVPRDLEAITLRAMARDPARRYTSALALAEDINRFLAREQVLARSPSAIASLLRRARRRPRLSAVVLGLLALGAGLALLAAVPARHFRPSDVAVGDFDGNGTLDIAISAFDAVEGGADHLALFLGNAKGRFTRGARVPVGDFPFGLASADLDSDGLEEFAVAERGDHTVSLYYNDGDSRWYRSQSVTLEDETSRPFAVDLDGDHVPELALTKRGVAKVLILKRGADGTFAEYASPDCGGFPDAFAAADVDRNGSVDLLCANALQKNIAVVTDPISSDSAVTTVDLGYHAMMLAAADLDGDGATDVAVAPYGIGGVMVLWNDREGRLAVGGPQKHAEGTAFEWVTAADLDCDGEADLVAAGGASNLAVFYNLGRREFGRPVPLSGAENPAVVRAVDVDRDGDVDLLVACVPERGWLAVYRNEGGGQFAPPKRLSLSLPYLTFH